MTAAVTNRLALATAPIWLCASQRVVRIQLLVQACANSKITATERFRYAHLPGWGCYVGWCCGRVANVASLSGLHLNPTMKRGESNIRSSNVAVHCAEIHPAGTQSTLYKLVAPAHQQCWPWLWCTWNVKMSDVSGSYRQHILHVLSRRLCVHVFLSRRLCVLRHLRNRLAVRGPSSARLAYRVAACSW